ncbi:MAG: amidohydrolase [Chloroflexi bacterium]|nr:amidohydrolase [Chloroflexota bacterium]
MIVDVHTHLPSHPDSVPASDEIAMSVHRSGTPVRFTQTVAEYLEAMEPVDKAFLFGIAPRPWAGDERRSRIAGWPADFNHNDVAAEVAKAAPGKIIPFMSLHPLAADVNDEYDRAVGDLGCRGIKMGANYQDFDPNGPEAYRLYARLEHDGIPIVWHMGTSPRADAPLEYAHPLAFDRVASSFPRLKMILAHMGHPWHVDALSVVRKHPNVYADISAQFYRPWSFWNGLRLFHEWGVTDRIFFATDWPVATPDENMSGIRNVCKFAVDHGLPEIPEQVIEEIINRDAAAILGVD